MGVELFTLLLCVERLEIEIGAQHLLVSKHPIKKCRVKQNLVSGHSFYACFRHLRLQIVEFRN
jgi:hypothetical protein